MALPWIIGAAVFAAGAALVKKLNEDSDDTSNSYDYEGESRRREEAAREREKNERIKKLKIAEENFLSRGEQIGADIIKALDGLIQVDQYESPSFSATIKANDDSVNQLAARKKSTEDLIPKNNPEFDIIRENLVTYSRTYKVRLHKGHKMIDVIREFEEIQLELDKIMKIKVDIQLAKDKLKNNET